MLRAPFATKRGISAHWDCVMSAEDVEVAERFRETLEQAVRNGDREPVYELLAPDVEWVTRQRTLHGIDDLRENWTWGASPDVRLCLRRGRLG